MPAVFGLAKISRKGLTVNASDLIDVMESIIRYPPGVSAMRCRTRGKRGVAVTLWVDFELSAMQCSTRSKGVAVARC